MSTEADRFQGIKALHKRFPWIYQFIRFGIVGLSNTLISYMTYAGLVWALSLESQISLQAANLLSFVISVLNAYFWNSRWVFRKETSEQKDQRAQRQSMAKFFISYGGMYLVSVVLLYLWTSVLDIDKYVAPVLTLLITVPANFVINKFWTFRASKKRREETSMASKDRPPAYFVLIFVGLLLFCFFGYCFIGDIRVTVYSSYAILNGHLRDFYAYNLTVPEILGNDYELPIYLLFALWNIPTKLFGYAHVGMFPLLVMLYNKLLICLVYALCAFLVRKISFLLYQDRAIANFTAISFFVCPVALFGPFIFVQYDVFYVVLLLYGIYYLLRDERRGDSYIGVSIIGLSLLFKPFALFCLLPFLLYRYKNLWRLLVMGFLSLVPMVATKLLFPGANGARFISRLFESSITISSWGVFKVSLFSVLFILLCIACYFKRLPDDKTERRLVSIYFMYASFVVFFILVLWHPMWLLIMMPFSILTMVASKDRIRLLLVELLMTAGFAGTTFISWGTNVAEDLLLGNALVRLGLHQSEGWTVSGLLSKFSIPFYSIFFAALVADLIIKYPLANGSGLIIEPITRLDWRYRLMASTIGILGCTIPPLLRYLV